KKMITRNESKAENSRLKLAIIIILFLSFLIILPAFAQESITLTTYYPSPNGIYKHLRLSPILTTNRETCDAAAAQEGLMYYDNGIDGSTPGEGLYYCDGISDSWQPIGAGGGGGSWLPTVAPNNIYYDTGFVGIGTNDPKARLHMDGHIAYNGNNFTIRANTVDGSDNGKMILCGGGTGGPNLRNQGAYIALSGNEVGDNGKLELCSGYSVGGSGTIDIAAYGKMDVDSIGDMDIHSSSDMDIHSSSNMQIYSSDGNVSINAELDLRLSADGDVFIGNNPQSQDIAEFMEVLKTDIAKEGEIVSLISNDKLGKTTKKNDENLIGVISGKKTSTVHLGNGESLHEDTVSLPVALVGRVFVKVANEGGAIRVGDPITSSSQPGIGMKANKTAKIVGYAMEAETFEENKDISEILVFVNAGYYVCGEDYQKLSKIDRLVESLSARIDALESKYE
ncbi:MAG: hypothetical protein ABIH08_05480, partial [Candidatus Omnitrophota bacterium]